MSPSMSTEKPKKSFAAASLAVSLATWAYVALPSVVGICAVAGAEVVGEAIIIVFQIVEVKADVVFPAPIVPEI